MQVVVLLLLAVFISDSHQQCFSENDATDQSDAVENYWTNSRLKFSTNLLKVLNKKKNRENLAFSPWSLQEALLLAYFGAANETERSLAKVLQIPPKQSKAYTWRLFYTAKKTQVSKEITMKTANKIFLSNKLHPRHCMEEKFGNELELLDYETDDGEWARNHINSWVESQTEGLITHFIEILRPETIATLVNAVYFKAKWLQEFSPNETQIMQFNVNKKYRKPTEMMVMRSNVKHGYSKSLGARMLMLPYDGNRTSMIILLPDGGLDPMINKMNDATIGYLTYEKNFNSETLFVYLPKFEHRSKMEINSKLRKLGIGEALTENGHYPGFTGKDEVFFNGGVHEAVIKVDEEGTEAAAATDFVAFVSAHPPPPKEFRCDRPFAYVIYDFKDRKILFVGTFRKPEPVYEK